MMTGRALLLIRHAKAVADALTDVHRPLTERGHRDAQAAGRWLAELGIAVDLVVVSPATRARETWAAIATTAPARDERIDERVYINTVEALLSAIVEIPDDVATLALVGHNPSMQGLAITLDDGDGDDEARAAIHDGYPTCGITVFDIDQPWAELAHGAATLRVFNAPRG